MLISSRIEAIRCVAKDIKTNWEPREQDAPDDSELHAFVKSVLYGDYMTPAAIRIIDFLNANTERTTNMCYTLKAATARGKYDTAFIRGQVEYETREVRAHP